jgi:hypothetical protein
VYRASKKSLDKGFAAANRGNEKAAVRRQDTLDLDPTVE